MQHTAAAGFPDGPGRRGAIECPSGYAATGFKVEIVSDLKFVASVAATCTQVEIGIGWFAAFRTLPGSATVITAQTLPRIFSVPVYVLDLRCPAGSFMNGVTAGIGFSVVAYFVSDLRASCTTLGGVPGLSNRIAEGGTGSPVWLPCPPGALVTGASVTETADWLESFQLQCRD